MLRVENYFEIIYYLASPPEHLVLVGDWGYWDGRTAGLIHPGENFVVLHVFCDGNWKCARCVAESTHITEFTPALTEGLL